MLIPLLYATLLLGPTPDDPPVRVELKGGDTYARGDRARVQVKVAEDGYLVVLRADADGRVRVVFPLDPTDDAFVRGGRTFEIRGRNDRDAFTVDEDEGTGMVLAARSADPFRFDEFVRGDHWDYRVLGADRVRDDPEAGLLDIVRRMAGDNHFDYDVIRYTVGSEYGYRGGYNSYYSSFYDPFWDSCFGCYGWGYRPRGYFGIKVVIGSPYWYGYRGYYRPYYWGPYYDPFCWGDPFCFGGFAFTYGGLGSRGAYGIGGPPFVLRNNATPTPIGVRSRAPITRTGFPRDLRAGERPRDRAAIPAPPPRSGSRERSASPPPSRGRERAASPPPSRGRERSASPPPSRGREGSASPSPSRGRSSPPPRSTPSRSSGKSSSGNGGGRRH